MVEILSLASIWLLGCYFKIADFQSYCVEEVYRKVIIVNKFKYV